MNPQIKFLDIHKQVANEVLGTMPNYMYKVICNDAEHKSAYFARFVDYVEKETERRWADWLGREVEPESSNAYLFPQIPLTS